MPTAHWNVQYNSFAFLLSTGCSSSEEPTACDNFKSKHESWLKIRSSFRQTVEDIFEQDYVVTYNEGHITDPFSSFGCFSREFYSETDECY